MRATKSEYCQLEWLPPSREVNNYDHIAPVYDEVMGDDFCRITFAGLRELFARCLDGASQATYLDLACGTGAFIQRMASEFGPKCYGIDLSPGQIAVARRKAHQASVDMTFRVGDVLQTELPASCDLVTMTFDALNHLRSPGDWASLFRRVHAALRHGGAFVFDVNSPQRLLHDWSHPEVIIKPNLTYVQCALDPKITPDCVRRQCLMLIYAEVESCINRYSALVEHIALRKQRVFQMLRASGFRTAREILLGREVRDQHVFLKNRTYFVACT